MLLSATFEAKGTWLLSHEQTSPPHKCLQPVAHQIWELGENFRIIWFTGSLFGVLGINLVKDEMGIHGKVLKQRGISHVLCAQHLRTFYMNCLGAFARAREAHWSDIAGYTLYFLRLSPAITWCVSLCLRIISGIHRSPDIMIPLALVWGVTQIFPWPLMHWQYWEVLCKYLVEKFICLGWFYIFLWFCLGWCMSVRKSFQVKCLSRVSYPECVILM